MSTDLKRDAKRAYDAAAEAYCEHVYVCPTCTMTGPVCDVGLPLLEAENTTWDAYRRVQGGS